MNLEELKIAIRVDEINRQKVAKPDKLPSGVVIKHLCGACLKMMNQRLKLEELPRLWKMQSLYL